MSEKKDRITLVCTSLGKNPDLLQIMLDTAIGFDEMYIHTDGDGGTVYKNGYVHSIWNDGYHRTIPEAYNLMIKEIKTEWVCCFCDDDYFYTEGLSKMIEEVHEGIVAGVAHYKFNVSGYMPKEDIRGMYYKIFGKSEYNLCEKSRITPKLLQNHNRLPAGSFFRKRAWEMAGGFQGDKCHDWDLWKRMAQIGIEFKYFDHLVYNMVRRENSAWCKQNS